MSESVNELHQVLMTGYMHEVSYRLAGWKTLHKATIGMLFWERELAAAILADNLGRKPSEIMVVDHKLIG